VVAAAVVLPFGGDWPGLTDSKQLPPEERARLAPLIRAQALAVGVGIASVEEIDALNILRASHLAMARALAEVGRAACFALVDGLPVQGLPCPHRALPKGDALCLSIAAASVIAKVTRDRLMEELDAAHPGYGFARHKGYPTPAHLAALAERGPCAIHRRTFRPVAELLRQAVEGQDCLAGALPIDLGGTTIR
jgi:ribonuclease HII